MDQYKIKISFKIYIKMDKNIIALGNNETEKQISVPQKSSGTFAPVRYSGFGIQFRYSVRTVPLDFKDFKDI